MRNSEGYYDPTAGIAIRNVERNERMMQEFKRGDIFYVEKSGSRAASGSNQPEGRPALIVSNDRFNKTSDILEVVYLTYNPRNDLPTHVTIRQTTSESVAICEQVTSVHKERFISYISSATEDEMVRIDMALLISLDLNMGGSQVASTASQAAPEPIPIPSPQPIAPPDTSRNWEEEYRAEKERHEADIADLSNTVSTDNTNASTVKAAATLFNVAFIRILYCRKLRYMTVSTQLQNTYNASIIAYSPKKTTWKS